jgi:hypothetical protein
MIEKEDPVRDLWQCKDCGNWYPLEEMNDLGYCITCTELDLEEEMGAYNDYLDL